MNSLVAKLDLNWAKKKVAALECLLLVKIGLRSLCMLMGVKDASFLRPIAAVLVIP